MKQDDEDTDSDSTEYFTAEEADEDVPIVYGFFVHMSVDGTKWYLPTSASLVEESKAGLFPKRCSEII